MQHHSANKVSDRRRPWWLIGLVVTVLLISACTVSESTEVPGTAGDWPAYGLDHSNSVYNKAESTLSPENVTELAERWRVDGIGGLTGTPAVVDGVVYFGDWFGFVRAVRADDGTVMWEEQVSQVPISASVAVTDEVVVAGDLAGVLHALGRDTGELLWSTQLNPLGASLFASPVVIDDSVVIGMTDTELGPDDPEFRASVVAIDIEDGAERWRLHTDPDDGSGTWVPIWSSVAYDPERGLVFVGTGNTNGPAGVEWAETDLPLADGVLAIDHDTGEMVWFFKLIEADQQRDFDVGASPNLFTISDRDVVGVGGKSGDYVVLDRDTGELMWKTHLTEGSAIGGVMSTAAIGDGVIYVASNASAIRDGTIFALESGDGSILWQRQFDPAIVGGSMALANGVLYRGIWNFPDPKGTVVALDADDGTVLWTEPLDGPLGEASPSLPEPSTWATGREQGGGIGAPSKEASSHTRCPRRPLPRLEQPSSFAPRPASFRMTTGSVVGSNPASYLLLGPSRRNTY